MHSRLPGPRSALAAAEARLLPKAVKGVRAGTWREIVCNSMMPQSTKRALNIDPLNFKQNVNIEQVRGMALEPLKAEIGLLLETMGGAPHDRYETYIQLKERLNELRIFGMPAPDDLLQLEAALDEQFSAERADQIRRTPLTFHKARHRQRGKPEAKIG